MVATRRVSRGRGERLASPRASVANRPGEEWPRRRFAVGRMVAAGITDPLGERTRCATSAAARVSSVVHQRRVEPLLRLASHKVRRFAQHELQRDVAVVHGQENAFRAVVSGPPSRAGSWPEQLPLESMSARTGPMIFGPAGCPSLSTSLVAYVQRDTGHRRDAVVPSPLTTPVHDAVLEVTCFRQLTRSTNPDRGIATA